MKYKVKNTVTGEETLCEKVVSCGEDYYIIDSKISYGDWVISKNSIAPIFLDGGNFFPEMLDLPQWNKVIATTNKSLNLPMVIDEVEELAENEHKYNHKSVQEIGFRLGFEVGYSKAKETYSFTKDDMVEFTEWLITKSFREGTSDYTTDELFDIWQEQRTKTILVK